VGSGFGLPLPLPLSFVTHHSNLTGIMKLSVMIKVSRPSTASATFFHSAICDG